MAWSGRLTQQQAVHTLAWTAILSGTGMLAAAAWNAYRGGSTEEFGLRLATVAVALFLVVAMSAVGGYSGAADYSQAHVHSRPRAFLQSSMQSEIATAAGRPLGPFVYAVLTLIVLLIVSVAVLVIW